MSAGRDASTPLKASLRMTPVTDDIYNQVRMIRWFKVVVFLACLGPLARLGWKAYFGGLGANPIEFITHSTGDWTLIFLCITLAITPLRMITRQYWLIRFRRMLGLYAFFYGSLHFTTYFWLDKFFDFHEIAKDIGKRPFITVGFTAFVLMIPLAVTSTKGWIRRLGGKNWNWLHRLIYCSAIAAVIHYYWLVKADTTKPREYAAVVGVLLGYRALAWAVPLLRKRTRPKPVQKPAPDMSLSG
jgi:sulfoxide reductase heme-binding subunit YedZ